MKSRNNRRVGDDHHSPSVSLGLAPRGSRPLESPESLNKPRPRAPWPLIIIPKRSNTPVQSINNHSKKKIFVRPPSHFKTFTTPMSGLKIVRPLNLGTDASRPVDSVDCVSPASRVPGPGTLFRRAAVSSTPDPCARSSRACVQ